MQNASNRPCRVFCLTPVPSDFLLLPNLFKPIFLPKAGETWLHFKNKRYEIIACPVIHSETREQYCVYKALYGDGGIYCRPLDMFMSEVDHVKYPDVRQKYRFEKIGK